MSLLDRVRDRLVHAPAGTAWDDGDAGDLADRMVGIAAALDPEPGDLRPAASRAVVLGAFAAATSGQVKDPESAPGRALPPAGAALGVRRGGRRPALVLVVTTLLVAMSIGAVAASAPGGPLYGLRVASEQLFLPGSPDDRFRAQVERLDARISEASGAAARGDGEAARAALVAYARIATEAATGAPFGESTGAQLALRVREQIEVLARIGADDRALDRVSTEGQAAARALLGVLGEPGEGPGPGPSGTGEPSPISTPSPSGSHKPDAPGASGGPGSSASPGPTASPNGPVASPSPAGTGGPEATSGPGKTPDPGQTPAASPGATPAATPRTTAKPTTPPGGGSSPGSPGDGSGATPRPSGGSIQAGESPIASATLAGRP